METIRYWMPKLINTPYLEPILGYICTDSKLLISQQDTERFPSYPLQQWVSIYYYDWWSLRLCMNQFSKVFRNQEEAEIS